MNKFLKLLIIMVITPFLIATSGFITLPNQIIAYIKEGQNVYIASYMIYTFAIVNLIITFLGVSYLLKVKKRFSDENYPIAVRVVAFINLLLSIMLNYFSYRLLISMLKNANIQIPFYIIRIIFSFIAVLIAFYGYYLKKATKESEFSIKNKYSTSSDIVFKYVNKFSSVVFFFGAIFILIMSWTMKSQRQLYIISLSVILICVISSQYISRMIAIKYKSMYKEKNINQEKKKSNK